MTLNITEFKSKLETEKARLETELRGVSVQVNPQNPDDWEATYDTPADMASHVTEIDPIDVAETIGNYEKGFALNKELEGRLNLVDEALAKIEAGTYGTCDQCGTMIPLARLEANPAATTCVVHTK